MGEQEIHAGTDIKAAWGQKVLFMRLLPAVICTFTAQVATRRRRSWQPEGHRPLLQLTGRAGEGG